MSKLNLILFLAGILMGSIFTGAVFAQRPGNADDPLIAKSYLQIATGYRQISINEGQSLSLKSGEEIVLVSGDIRLECPGDFFAHDISKGKLHKNPERVEKEHLVIFISNSSITVNARGDSIILVRGIAVE